MKQLLSLLSLLCSISTYGVSPGINHFAKYEQLLQGKRVGIIANQTSVTLGEHSVDFLTKNAVNLVRIYCPEHGFRGTADAGEFIQDGKDSQTGLPMVSVYGKKKKPSVEALKDIDIMIFDLQDVGVRFYTYISTLHYIMEACAEQSIPLIVMDRPNPNAFYIDGPVLEPRHQSFVGMHPVPIVYGMTIGEYAQMINGEHWLANGIQCTLTVVPVTNWERNQLVELPIKPSPNLPDTESVLLYPSTCLFEGTVISEGRGTQHPFVLFGHPDLKNMPYQFTPRSIPGMSKHPKCENQVCYGMNLTGEGRRIRQQKQLELKWILNAYANYKGKAPFFISFFEKLSGTSQLKQQIIAGKSEKEIRDSWQSQLHDFRKIRAKYLIYP